ncbi:MAG: UvrD-helicase domain-containing protein [Candidatus Nanopelagicales bacterium]
MNRTDLTPRQLEVVDATAQAMLVTGGAGTGKTTVALWAARSELERPGNEQKRALFLTFSRTAVDQIGARSRAAVAPVEDRIEVSTFHSFAYRLVRRFGFLTGSTPRDPAVQSASAVKLLGRADDQLIYDDLAPLARQILNDPRVAALLAERWCMVVCDEFQDTGNSQWAILEWLSQHARMLLLGDENQMIYGFLSKSGVVPERMAVTRTLVDNGIELEPKSHRDPSGAIPAFAVAMRERRFDDLEVGWAIAGERLHIHSGVDDDQTIDAIGAALDAAWNRGCRTFGVFAHSNQSVADLSFQLDQAGIDHYLVGLPDAEADALTAMLAITQYAYGDAAWSEVGIALGTYLTACSRGRTPDLARAFANGTPLPTILQRRVEELQRALSERAESSLGDVSEVAANAWPALGITVGEAPWLRATLSFRAVARRSAGEPATQVLSLTRSIAKLRVGAMIDSQPRRLPAVQVMNLHQTKGREVDAVVLLCGDDDFHGYEGEPFVEGSRLLYVTLTRARKEVTVILGHQPHGLVAPIAALI